MQMIDRMIKDGHVVQNTALSPQALAKIRQCAFHSRLKRDLVDLLIRQKLIDVKRLEPPAR